MIHMEYAVPVHASRTAAWRMLTERIASPQSSLPHVTSCEVTERDAGEVVRRVTFDDGVAVTERVLLVPEEEVVFRLIDHPKFEGEIRNLLFHSAGELWLAFYFRGEARPGVQLAPEEFEQLRDGFARAVRFAARQIEAEDRSALERT
ncbi:MAG TPA: AtaL-like protein [Longimicrobiales bacterium]